MALSLIPRMLMSGLLVYIGVTLLHRWVIEVRTSLSRPDYLVVVTILVVIVLSDLLWGVILGLALAVVTFVVDYSRVSLIRYEVTGSELRSRVQRARRDAETILEHGSELVIIALQGYLFFGTAHQLLERVRRHTERAGDGQVRAVLLDFGRVSGLDSTAAQVFARLAGSLRAAHVELILTGLPTRLLEQSGAGGHARAIEDIRRFDDLDRGIEWGEEVVLSAHRDEEATRSLEQELRALLPGEPDIAELIRHMERTEYRSGEIVVRQGEAATALYLVESGHLTARLDRPGRPPLRLATVRPGGIVGEIGFFLGTRRSATVVADVPSVVRVLSRARWEHLAATEPEAARLIQLLTIRVLGQRLVDSNRAVDALLR